MRSMQEVLIDMVTVCLFLILVLSTFVDYVYGGLDVLSQTEF